MRRWQGQSVAIMLKMNALTDEALSRALAHASQCGVKVDVIVRGACILPAGVPGVTDNVRVRSVIGRMLEHSRVFRSQIGDDDQVWLSSADWMNRNMLRRVEMAWPVTDPVLKQRVIDECLTLYLADNLDAWLLQPDGVYTKARQTGTGRGKKVVAYAATSAQATLMARYGRKA
jgi:polyphosphate kinase